MRVLVIDPDPEVCESIEAVLEFSEHSHHVTSVRTGEEALAALDEEDRLPDVIFGNPLACSLKQIDAIINRAYRSARRKERPSGPKTLPGKSSARRKVVNVK